MQSSGSFQTAQPNHIATNSPSRPWRSSDSTFLPNTIPTREDMASSSLPPPPTRITMNHGYRHLHPQGILANLDVLPNERRNQMEIGMPAHRHDTTTQRLRSNRGHTVIDGVLYTREMRPVAVNFSSEALHDQPTSMPSGQRRPSSAPGTASDYPSTCTSPPRNNCAYSTSDSSIGRDQHRSEVDTQPPTNNPHSVCELPASPLGVQQRAIPLSAPF